MSRPTSTRVLKLYVWEGVLTDYTSGIMFALARTPWEARRAIKKKLQKELGSIGSEDAKELDQKPTVYFRTVGFYLVGGS